MFERDFEELLRKYGAAIDDKKRFAGLVKDLFPNQIKNINLLLMAYDLGIAGDIKQAEHIGNAFAFRYVKQLVDDYGLSRVNADWIVSVWCVCYGNRILGKNCDIRLQEKGQGAAIKEDSGNAAEKYGDLFQYVKSHVGNGLSVVGFKGDKRQTIIFQNRSNGGQVLDIGDESFRGEGLQEVILAEGIKIIGKEAFADCRNLHQIVLPISIVEIGDYALENCISLKTLSLPQQVERLGDGAFKGAGLKTVTFPAAVYWIGEYLLADCTELDNVLIPENIDKLPKGMFENCISLKKVRLHEKLTEIGERTFAGCKNLAIITIPDSVKAIGMDAFMGTDKQFIIQCSFGSYAEEYARKNKIKYQLV